MIVQAVPYQDFSLDALRAMGWWNAIWFILLAFLFLAARAKKVGVTSIGKNEWGMLEIFGFPLVPIPFGIWPFIKGVFHVKQVSTVPTRVNLVSRREINKRVLLVIITVWVRVTKRAEGSRMERIRHCFGNFIQLRRDLIAAIYGALDENVDDSENPARIEQTLDILEDGTRTILKGALSVDDVTMKSLEETCGEKMRTRLGEYIDDVFIREDAPVDGQLWKEGRTPSGPTRVMDDDIPPAASGKADVLQLPTATRV